MPRPKRSVRASGLARSLGAGPGHPIRCVVCERWLPREAIAFWRRKPDTDGKPFAVCGECYRPGGAYWGHWS